jgi:hypothetical protein
MDELLKLVAFMNRFPALRKAFTSMQSAFDDVAEPTDDDLAFIMRVRGAPLLIGASSTKWPLAYLVPTAAKNEDATEAAIADLTERRILVLRHEPVAEEATRRHRRRKGEGDLQRSPCHFRPRSHRVAAKGRDGRH